MKQILLIAAMTIGTLSLSAQSMKMVVNNRGEVIGRYLGTRGNNYLIRVQDEGEVPKAGLKVVTFSAANGQGIVYRHSIRKGNINVRKGPGTKFPVVTKIPEFHEIPNTYPCLGKEKGWYKIRINGKVGYLRKDMAVWDGMNTF